MPRITALEIENFQSIKDRMRIEFAPITLLYGPNSAGKSAVFDALDLIECIWDPTKFNSSTAEEMVARWMRVEAGKALPLYLSIEFAYKIEEAYPADVWGNSENWSCKKTRTENPVFFFDDYILEDDPDQTAFFIDTTIRLEVQISNIKGEGGSFAPTLTYIRISTPENQIFEFGKYLSESCDLSEIPDDAMYLRWYGREAVLNGDMPFFDPSIAVMASRLEGKNSIKSERGYSLRLLIPNLDLLSISPVNENVGVEFDSIVSIFSRNAEDLLFYFGSLIGDIFRKSTPVVRADRRVPVPNEALFVIDNKHTGWWDAMDRFAAGSPASLLSKDFPNRDPHYYLLAKSAHSRLLLEAAKDDWYGSDHALKYLKDDLTVLSVFLERVNHHLESSLFREKLYKVECASTLMVPIDLSVDDPWGYYALAQPAAVRLYLRDGEGRRVELQDVGSGIPFVLPVLYSSVSGELSRNQQPELHLHPALQADLADVFLEESNKDKNRLFITETHSEHLLLRFLRRIRDTEKGVLGSEALPMKPQDIAIYYFDPQVTGGTYAIKQVVTPLGDFYHDWPRGFFADRDKDLFE